MDKIENFKWKKEYLYIIVLILFLSIGLLLWYCFKNNKVEEAEPELVLEKEISPKTKGKIKVDIKGQVIKPGVYEMELGQTIDDLINKSGGLTNDADTSYLNRARKLKDEMVIIVYSKLEIEEFKKGEVVLTSISKCNCPQIKNDGCLKKEEIVTNKDANNEENDKEKNDLNTIININTATLEELQTLTGIGLSKAQDIIKYREENNLFKTIEEIKEVKGIGDAIYEKIKSQITI